MRGLARLCTFITSVAVGCVQPELSHSTRNQAATWHIRKCSYQPDTEKVAVSRGVKEPATLSLSCHVPILTNSLWHTVIEKMTAETVLPEKMITLERVQWEEVSRNKRHFHDFTSGIWMLWKLACTQRSGLFQCEVGLMSDSWHTTDMESSWSVFFFISVSVCWIKYVYWFAQDQVYCSCVLFYSWETECFSAIYIWHGCWDRNPVNNQL